LKEKNVSLANKDIKTISVTKRTYGIIKGISKGLLAGAVYGGTLVDLGGDSNSGHHPDYYAGADIMIY